MFVVDASAVLQAVAPDEQGRLGEEIRARIELEGAFAPPGFADEVVQAAAKGVRMGRWSADTARSVVAQIADLEITLADRVRPSLEQLEVALELGLTGLDAAYVHLARETGLPLATADRTMRAAAERAGVRTML